MILVSVGVDSFVSAPGLSAQLSVRFLWSACLKPPCPPEARSAPRPARTALQGETSVLVGLVYASALSCDKVLPLRSGHRDAGPVDACHVAGGARSRGLQKQAELVADRGDDSTPGDRGLVFSQ